MAVRPGAVLAPAAEVLPAREGEGLRAEVKRVTTVLANYDPNASTRTTWSEVWDSPELGVRLLTKLVDAEGRQRTTALKNIHRGTPAAELFAVPDGYEVRDETRAFLIEWTLR